MAGGGIDPGGAPGLFGETALRRHLSNMYAAMVASTGNARLLLDRDPADVRREDAEGGEAARSQLDEACAWLDEARATCAPQAFEDAILGCAKRAASYLVEVRGAGASTDHFDSWVFAKSAPQDDAGAGARTVVSAIVPALEACMSVRVPPDAAAAISRGRYNLGPATPMPLTNRLHFVSGATASPLPDRPPGLAGWDFLKASPHDLHALSESIEMDAYCEIASVQDGLRQRLGAPVVVPGAVVDLDDHSVVIGGLGGEKVTAVRYGGSPPEPDGLPRGDDIGRAPCGHGRFLVAAWYQPGIQGRPAPAPAPAPAYRAPELLHFEPCGRDEAALDDLIGYVRMRGRAEGAGGLRTRYGPEWRSIASGTSCLDVRGGAAEYRRARRPHHGGSPAQEFFSAVDDMRAAWSRCRTDGQSGSLPASPCDIVPEGGTDTAALSSWMGRGAAASRTLLADMQHEFDRTGYWPGEREGGPGSGRGSIPHRAAALERLGLLRRDEHALSVTDRGLKALAASFRQDVRQHTAGKDVLYLPEIESRTPASVLLWHLRNGGDFERAAGPRGKNPLLWVRKGADAEADADLAAELQRCEAVLAEHHGIILECTRTANHEINARFVRGELERRGKRVAFLHVLAMLEQLERAGRLEAAGGGSWVYPLRGRILDTMRENRARAWDMDGILGAAGIGRNDIEGAGAALEGLAAGGLVVGLEDGRWECSMDKMDGAGQRRRRAVHLARAAALSALRQKRAGMDSGRLVELLAGHLSVQFKSRPVRGLRQIARDAVSGLVEDGRAAESGGMVRLAA